MLTPNNMRLVRLVAGELILLVASVLVFRSLWLLLDKHFSYNHLEIMLIAGLATTILGLILLNKELNIITHKKEK